MVPNPILGHHTPPVRNIGIVAKCENTSVGYFQRQQSLRPRVTGTFRPPCLFSISSETMYEDNAMFQRLLALTPFDRETERWTNERTTHSTTLSSPSCSSLIPEGNTFCDFGAAAVVESLLEEGGLSSICCFREAQSHFMVIFNSQ